MSIFFVTRHPGARDWAAEESIIVDRWVEHFDPEEMQPDDIVIGTLPVNLAAQVCARGGRYLHLTLDLPQTFRGRELNAIRMRDLNARIEEYQIIRVSEHEKKI